MRVLLLSSIAALVAVAAPGAGATPVHPVPTTGRSQAGLSAAADGVVRDAMRKQNIPGVALVVLRDGKVVHQAGYGIADLEQDLPVRPDTAFNIGSLSKQFLAEGILLLVQEGKVALDAPVSRYLPDVPSSWSAITIRHLLSHTGGLVREAPGFDGAKVQSDIDVIRSAYGVPLNAPAGTRFEYSNLGYFILAEVISRTSGKPWPAFFAERVFGPLGMNATRPTSLVDLSRIARAAMPGRRGASATPSPIWRFAPAAPSPRPSPASPNGRRCWPRAASPAARRARRCGRPRSSPAAKRRPTASAGGSKPSTAMPRSTMAAACPAFVPIICAIRRRTSPSSC